MPTVYSDAYWTGAYTYTRVKVEYSGTSATAILLYSRTNTYSGQTRSGSNTSFNFGGGSADMSLVSFYGKQTDAEICRCSFSISSTTEQTYSGYTSGDAGMLAFSGSVTIPAQSSPPTGLSVTLVEPYTNGALFNVSVSSYGVPSGKSDRWIEAGILNQNSYGAPYRYNYVHNTSSSAITVNNTSSGTLTIQPNKRYYYGAYASNTVLSTKTVKDTFVTKAEAATILFNSSTAVSANFSYSVSADGGYYDRAIQYSLDNGLTWATAVTVTGGSAKSGNFTISGLLSGMAYTMRTRVNTTAGVTEGGNISFDTLVSKEDNKNLFYGPVNGKTKEAKIIYGSVNDAATRITRLYGSAPDYDLLLGTIVHTESISQRWGVSNFFPTTFASKLKNGSLWDGRTSFDRLEVVGHQNTNPRIYDLWLFYKNNTSVRLASGASNVMATYGVQTTSLLPVAADTRDLIILKPRQVARLVHQGFGHVNYT